MMVLFMIWVVLLHPIVHVYVVQWRMVEESIEREREVNSSVEKEMIDSREIRRNTGDIETVN